MRITGLKLEMVRAILKNMLALLLGLLLALVLLEGLIRIFEPIEFRVRGNKLQLPINRKYIIKDLGIPKLDKEIYLKINWLGFRGKNPPKDFADYLTIIAVGGSTTYCLYNSDGQTWVDLLGKKLETSFQKVWINNAGLDGQSTIGHRILMEDIIVNLKPKVVLFLVGANDQFLDEHKNMTQYLKKTPKLIENLLVNSETYYYITNFYRYYEAQKIGMFHDPVDMNKLGNQEMTEKQAHEAKEEHRKKYLTSYSERLIKLIQISRKHGIEPIFITQPYLLGEGIDDVSGVNLANVKVRSYNGKVAWQILELYNDVLRQTGKEHQVLVIDLAREFPKNSKYYYDFYHYTNEGSTLVADLIYNRLYPFLENKYSFMLNRQAVSGRE
jgi:lysophospholipase L1-like esterase